MSRSGGLKPHPSDYLAPEQTWPNGKLAHDAPPEARLAKAISQRLNTHLTEHELSLRDAAQPTATLHNIIHGRTWSDMTTLARIEHGLRISAAGVASTQSCALATLTRIVC